jgi:YD repeat-containing protein
MPRNFAGLQMADMRRYSDSVINAAAFEVHSRYAYDGAGKISSITHARSEIAAGRLGMGLPRSPLRSHPLKRSPLTT